MAQLDQDRYKRLTTHKTYGQDDGLFWDTTNSRLVMVVGDTVYEVPAHIASQARGDILRRGANSWERHAAKTSGQILVGDGTDIASVAVSGDVTLSSSGVTAIGSAKVLSAMMHESLMRMTEATISSADITSTSSGKLGHANGYEIVAAPGADKVIEFLGGIIVLDYATAAYTAGGDVSIKFAAGGDAVSTVVAAADSVGGSADKKALLFPSFGYSPVTNAGLHLVAETAFTNPGTAAGVVRTRVCYRIHDLGLD